MYRGVRPDISVQGKNAILVDDGIATGSSMLAAISALRTLQPKRIVVAVPVAPSHADEQIKRVADEFVCVDKPELFFGVGQFYENFSQTEDSDVHALLERAAKTPLASHKSEKIRAT
jgi:putative phosphoribosyl transferase